MGDLSAYHGGGNAKDAHIDHGGRKAENGGYCVFLKKKAPREKEMIARGEGGEEEFVIQKRGGQKGKGAVVLTTKKT